MRQFIINRPTCSACGRGKCGCKQLRNKGKAKRNAEGDAPAIDFAALAELLGVQADPNSDPVAYIGELRDSLGAALADDSEVDHAALAALLGVEADPAQAIAFAKALEAAVGEVVAKLGGSAPSAPAADADMGIPGPEEDDGEPPSEKAIADDHGKPRTNNRSDADAVAMTSPVYNFATKQLERHVNGRVVAESKPTQPVKQDRAATRNDKAAVHNARLAAQRAKHPSHCMCFDCTGF